MMFLFVRCTTGVEYSFPLRTVFFIRYLVIHLIVMRVENDIEAVIPDQLTMVIQGMKAIAVELNGQ